MPRGYLPFVERRLALDNRASSLNHGVSCYNYLTLHKNNNDEAATWKLVKLAL